MRKYHTVTPKTFKGLEGKKNPPHRNLAQNACLYRNTQSYCRNKQQKYSKDKCKVYSTYATISQDVREVSKFVLLTYGNSFILTIHCNRVVSLEKTFKLQTVQLH